MPKKVSSQDHAVRLLRDLDSVRDIPQRQRVEVTKKLIGFAREIRDLPMPDAQRQAIAVRAMEAIFCIGERDPASAKLLRTMASDIKVARNLYADVQMRDSAAAPGGRGGPHSPGTGGRDVLLGEEMLKDVDLYDDNMRDDESKRVVDKDWDWYRWKYYRERKRVDEKYEIVKEDIRDIDHTDDEMRAMRELMERAEREQEERLLDDERITRPRETEDRVSVDDDGRTGEDESGRTRTTRTRTTREERTRFLRENQARRMREERERLMREEEMRRTTSDGRTRAMETERMRRLEEERRLDDTYSSGSSSNDDYNAYDPNAYNPNDYNNDDR